ncbi:MAG: lysine--tRNA ligase [Planctomycetaceae bacterium]|nr:lysine--tRNA ligase [Planctomycetaceae bacterium]
MTDLAHPDRLDKVARLRAAGIDPYPARGVEAEPLAELVRDLGSPQSPGPRVGARVKAAGRLLSLRDFGKLIFAPLVDKGGRIQLGFQRDVLTDWWPNRKLLDGGDLVGVEGELGFTQKGEPTLWVHEVHILAKSVAPPPEKWHGLVDKELRYRRRYVDLWSSPGIADVFVARSRIVSKIRRDLEARGFLEVETPVLQPIAGGAAAKPFVTHHNALGLDMYLRIAPELYLKRLIVGGLEKVFEFARNFRNEGLSLRHNPEFTMLEVYWAQADYRHQIQLTEELIEAAAREANGSTHVRFRDREYDLRAPFRRVSYMELFEERNGCAFRDEAAVRAIAKRLGIREEHGYPKLANDVFEATCEDALEGVVFVVGYPIEISPLAKADPENPGVAERFELFVGGMEVANGFSELNDPAEQARRFEEQIATKDPEAPGEVDVDYVQALEYGMPPTAGVGIGIDRLVMVLTGQDSIRDVLLFPTLRPLHADTHGETQADGESGAAGSKHAPEA